jgi:beta-aspartyl-peptidase (threonine type)
VDDVVIAVHGGAGTVPPCSLTEEQEQAHRDGLRRALLAGSAVLDRGGSSLDAVEAAVRELEDEPSFNAGRGAYFDNDGHVSLDASIMDGRDRRAGAVAGVRNVRNPVSLARLVMERSSHVLLIGRGADIFALRNEVAYTTQDYFFTQRRWDQLVAAKNGASPDPVRHGETVGAVARDRDGNLAAATSTGGTNNQLVGRVGDTPVIGAGTYANNRTVAVSCTGTGEVFIRGVAAYDISAMIEYAGVDVVEATNTVIFRKVPALGNTGGAIALDAAGRFAAAHCTPGLVNGYLTASGELTIRLYDNETPFRQKSG